jgi:hypothetical protein
MKTKTKTKTKRLVFIPRGYYLLSHARVRFLLAAELRTTTKPFIAALSRLISVFARSYIWRRTPLYRGNHLML